MAQSAEIERDAFPALTPPTSFRRELTHRAACYLVAPRCDGPGLAGRAPAVEQSATSQSVLGRLIRGAREAWTASTARESTPLMIAGYVGIWYMGTEAHIVSIGVRTSFRGKGIGELLLIGSIEQALLRSYEFMALEVRVSNHVAQNLYLKYGFAERGLRKGYYADNREDALIMTTEPIHSPQYNERFRSLVQEHEDLWGPSHRIVL